MIKNKVDVTCVISKKNLSFINLITISIKIEWNWQRKCACPSPWLTGKSSNCQNTIKVYNMFSYRSSKSLYIRFDFLLNRIHHPIKTNQYMLKLTWIKTSVQLNDLIMKEKNKSWSTTKTFINLLVDDLISA